MGISLVRNIYRPTSSEEKKYADLLMALQLPVATYDRYRRQAQAFLSLFAHQDGMRRASGRRSGRSNASPSRRATPAVSNGITNFEMRRSDLFGREYLVAYADAAWLRELAPGNDAIASPCAAFNSSPSPALVLIPGSREKADDPAFLSILEHEFIHVHQILLGTFPDSELDTADKCLREILRIARAEYEANLIELVRWPRLYSGVHARHGISLEDFCTLRGYTQGLQRIFHAGATGKLEESELLEFLGRLPAALPSGFRCIGLNERLGEEYARKLPDHVVATLAVLAMAAPELTSSLYRPALGRWLKRATP